METSTTKLGVDHPDTLTSMNNLAFTWKGNGKEIEAVRLMEDCIRGRKRVLGVNHPYSISSCIALDTWKAKQQNVVVFLIGSDIIPLNSVDNKTLGCGLSFLIEEYSLLNFHKDSACALAV